MTEKRHANDERANLINNLQEASQNVRPQPKLVAEFHVPLKVRHLDAFADALQLAIGEVLYFQGGGLRVVSYGEPYPPVDDGPRDE